jgi:hypothetical protein
MYAPFMQELPALKPNPFAFSASRRVRGVTTQVTTSGGSLATTVLRRSFGVHGVGKKDVEERGVNSLATVTVSWNVLTETMERGQMSVSIPTTGFSQSRHFSVGRFGREIALPLQWKPRQIGNSLFLDDKPPPYEGRWAFPSEVRRFSRPAQLVQVSSLWVKQARRLRHHAGEELSLRR